ncbi:MAG: DUF3800 domain-containing protein [Patescibacteria group bacterium]
MYAFIDESGDHNLDIITVDNSYNVFVLGTILIKKEDYDVLDREFKRFKKDFFGGEDFILHTAELTHPNHKKSDKRNRIMYNPKKRAEFYTKINLLLENAPFSVCFVVIRKLHFITQYVTPLDPYDLSFENALNRILYYSKSNNINIYAEKRIKHLDIRLELDFQKYRETGIEFHSAEEIKQRINNFELKDKKENITGLQIIDLFASPVGRHFLGKPPRPLGNEVPYILAMKKLAGPIALTTIPS